MANIYYEPKIEGLTNNRRWFQNVKLVGELDEGTSLYIEDYVYTYLYQYANSDLSCEKSAALIGKHYKEVDQIVIYGIIPITTNLVDSDTKWINKEILHRLEDEKHHYFPDSEYVGWMHTQPGYGIMMTTQEAKVHREVFKEEGTLLLVDPIHKVETFFVYGESELVEKRGFCMYYERNEPMQQYMIDYPIIEKQKSEATDEVVVNFREMGARRKREAERRRRMSMIMSLTIISLLLTTTFVMGIYEQHRKINAIEKDIMNINEQYSSLEYKINDNPVKLVFNEQVEKPIQKAEGVEVSELIVEDIPKEEELAVKQEEKPAIKEKPAETEYDIYAVQTGDSLLGISYKYYKTVKMANKIAEFNSIKNKDAIYIGQKLKLPKVSQ